MDDFHGQLSPLVSTVASSVSRTFPSYITSEDTEQAIWIWVYEKRNSVQETLNSEGWEKKLRSTMTKVGNTYALTEEAATNGYSLEDVFHYTTNVIKELLEVVYDYEDWQSFGAHGDGQPTAKGQVNMTGDRIAMLVDVKAALESLDEQPQQVLYLTYRHHYTAANVGDTIGITEEAAKKRIQRAVGAVQRALGRKPLADLRMGYTGRTDPVSTADAISRTESDYSG